MTIEDSVLYDNFVEVWAQGINDLDIRTSFIVTEGSSESLVFDAFAGLSISYSTIVGPISYPAIDCWNGIVGEIRSSILAGGIAPAVNPACGPGLTISDSAVDEPGLGPTNAVIGSYDPAWFVDPSVQDLHLDPGQLAITTTAERQPGDPLEDFDGDPIPAGPGASYPGADQP